MINISGIKRIAFVVLAAFILSACRGAALPAETPTPREAPLHVETPTLDVCSSEHLRLSITTIDDAAQRFEDAAHLAENTLDENLEPVIKEMQAIRQEAGEADTLLCAITTEAALDSYMHSKIQCYFKIYADAVVETPLAPGSLCSLATSQLEYYNTKMNDLKGLLLEKSALDT